MIVYVDGPDLLAHLAERDDPLIAEDDLDRTHQNLALWLARYCELSDCRGVLVFDDLAASDVRTPTERRGPVRVTNLPYGEEALSEIAGPANRSAAEERTVVVTNDYRLRDAVARSGANVLSPGQFVARVRRSMGRRDEMKPDEPDEKFAGLTGEEVEFWVRYFEKKD